MWKASRLFVRSPSLKSKLNYSASAAAAQTKPKRQRKFESPVEVSDNLTDEHIFTADHVELRRTLRKTIEKDINPHVDEWEKDGIFPAHHVFKILGNAGFLGVNKPIEYGGLGLDITYTVAVHEELAHVTCGGIPMAVGVQTDMCTPALTNYGSHELKQKFLAPSIAGDFVGCVGVSEASAGSDVANILTKAEKKGDDYVINGSKMWITNSAQADWICLLANTSAGPNIHMNKSLICVPMDTKGITKQPILNKLGMRSSDTCQIFFEDVVVPQSYRIGDEGKGFIYQMQQFQDERIVAAAFVPEIITKLVQETANYCYQREAFGKPLLDKQVIHFRMAELQTEAELLRSLLYRAAGQYANGKDVTLFASMLKLKAGRLVREASDSLLQYWGGMGFTDTHISRVYRDTRLLSIGGGADEVMLEIICKFMDTLPR